MQPSSRGIYDLLHECHRWCYTNFTNVSKFSSAGGDDNRDNGDVSSSSAATHNSGRSAPAIAATEGNSLLDCFLIISAFFATRKAVRK